MRLMMHILVAEGVALRGKRRLRRHVYYAKGPNFLWHLDSYDKLKPYGICINGCIDGFSRYIVWLNAYTTSSNPKVIAGYYIEAISSKMACPKLMRSDHGTENGTVCFLQTFLSKKKSFIHGPSMHNQRIESWWQILRTECSQFWINIFENLNDGLIHFTGDFIDVNLVQFCFMKIIDVNLVIFVKSYLWIDNFIEFCSA